MEWELWKYLKTVKKPIVLYGMGNGADKIIKVLKERGIPFDGVFASDGFVRDKTFHGFKISSYAELKERFGSMAVLLCFGSARDEVLENIKRISAEDELYAPDVPVIGGGMFDEEYYYNNKSDLDKVYELLADELSKKTFINTIKYKISGKLNYLYDCETDFDEPYDSFFKLSEDESFLDLGAYNGDTVRDFISRTANYKKITAAEGDAKTFKKLAAGVEKYENIKCYNYCISNFCGKAPFGMKHARGSAAFTGETLAEYITVDALLDGEEVTYIKMDIEGEEKNAIAGAKETILKYRPKILTACYHRTEDLISLPRAVLDIRDDYKIYMRHFKSLPAWDTNYYFV